MKLYTPLISTILLVLISLRLTGPPSRHLALSLAPASQRLAISPSRHLTVPPSRSLSLSLAPQAPPSLSREDEEELLKDTVSQLGDSPIEFIRGMERHLRLYPNSPRKDELQKAILRAAIDANDNARILSYGEKVLEHDNDPTLLDRVARALLSSDDPTPARRSLKYSERLEKSAPEKSTKDDPTRASALALQSRAWGNVGDLEKALALARRSYDLYPNGEAASEAARWELKLGRLQDALEHYADAFAIPDPKVTAEDRKHHRTVMGEIYTKLHGSEAGLGDLILRAYDRTSRGAASQAAAGLQPGSPQDAFEFPLPGLRGDSIRLSDFSGKVLVLDFWATWCVPCRIQHPLLEKIKTKYKNQDVVFLSINTDESRKLVKPFIEEQQWSNHVYFEDGLSRFYHITTIPTTMIFNKRKELVARLPGFTPTSFLELLTEKIGQALKE